MTTLRSDSQQGDFAVPLDALLGVNRTERPSLRDLPEIARWTTALARRPRATTSRLLDLATEIGRIVAGASKAAPSTRDRRFADPAWTSNPLLRRSVQAYLATSEKALQLVDDAGFDERTQLRMRLLVENLVDALAPSNNPFLNPTAMKAVVDSGGISLVRGVGHLAGDLAVKPRVPSMVDTSAFEVGVNVAASKGAVVLRTPVLELIQYTPTTEVVREVPVLVLPPTINKHYILDLAEGRSLVEYLLSRGQQVFMVSWRNPTALHADWNLDTYINGALQALDAVKEVTRVDRVALFGTCSGGIIGSMAAAYLAGMGRGGELAALTLAVTVLDQSRGPASALIDRKSADAAMLMSKRKGYLDGAVLAEIFAWLRPNDLIWNYWVNNYLLGRTPPAFDILYWNADTTRMSAGLHRDFLELSLANKLVTPGHATALGVPVDLGTVSTDAYIVGGETDHITPWQSCYRSTALLGGKNQFVLSTSGHVAALVNPPSNPKASFRTSSDSPSSAEDFQAAAETHAGSWWPHYADWLAARTGETRPAPASLGGPRLPPLDEAPGTYVHDH